MMIEAFERQNHHRIYIERCVIDQRIGAETRGQHYALIVTIAALGTVVALGLAGEGGAAAAVGGTTVVSLATVFLLGRNSQERERRANEAASADMLRR